MKIYSPLPIVLGIDLGARQIGASVFEGEELVFCAIKTIKGANSRETLAKMRRIIRNLIAEYGVTHVALEKIAFIQQHRSFVKIVFEELRDFLSKQKILYSEYNPKTVRQELCENEKPTKRNIALILSQRYYELSPYLSVSKVWQQRYFAQMQDAVAVGLVCAKQIANMEE